MYQAIYHATYNAAAAITSSSYQLLWERERESQSYFKASTAASIHFSLWFGRRDASNKAYLDCYQLIVFLCLLFFIVSSNGSFDN